MDKFKITGGKGFHLTIGKYTLSVQFGAGNYCEHHDDRDYKLARETYKYESSDAEIAIFLEPDGEWATSQVVRKALHEKCDDVMGWVSPIKVGKIIAWMTGKATKTV